MRRLTLLSAAAVFLVLLVSGAGTSHAATDAFVKFDGIDGEARDSAHKGWSDIESFVQAIHKPSSGTGATALSSSRPLAGPSGTGKTGSSRQAYLARHRPTCWPNPRRR